MKKGKKAAIIIIAVIAAAAIVVGGLVLGGVIPVGNKRTASAQEIAVDDTAMTAYKTIPQVYKITLKSLYGLCVLPFEIVVFKPRQKVGLRGVTVHLGE